MTKKIGIYIGCVVLGFVLCYMTFGSQNNQNLTTKNQTNPITNQQWSCSMHPQIKENESGTCPLCAMDLVIIKTNSVDDELSNNQFKMSKQALALANIETSQIGYNDAGEAEIELSGIVTTNKETDATQTTIFEGRIEALYANSVGTKIRKGKQIGVVYSPDMYLGQTKLLSSISYRTSHPELFAENRNTYGLWKMTDQQIENIIVSEKPMMNFPIYADVSGTITEVLATEGNFYKEGDALFKTSDLRTVWAVFDAYENQLNALQTGQNVELTSSGFPKGHITGTINFIEPLLDNNKRTASVRVVLNNKDAQLKPGMLIKANVKSQLEDGILTVPKTAVLWTGKRSVVYVKPYANKPYFEMTEVTLGQSLNEKYEILSGLNIGDEIVTEGTFTVDAVAQLQGKKSMMNTMNHVDLEPSSTNQNKDVSTTTIDWNMIKKDDIHLLIKNYLALKDALVSSDAKMTLHYGNKMLETLKTVNLENHTETQKNKFSMLSQITETLASSNDLKLQRASFKPLSKLFVEIASSQNLDQPVYIQFCPMADDNTGANWLSLEDNIMNPYFGDKMLNCGSVLEKIK